MLTPSDGAADTGVVGRLVLVLAPNVARRLSVLGLRKAVRAGVLTSGAGSGNELGSTEGDSYFAGAVCAMAACSSAIRASMSPEVDGVVGRADLRRPGVWPGAASAGEEEEGERSVRGVDGCRSAICAIKDWISFWHLYGFGAARSLVGGDVAIGNQQRKTTTTSRATQAVLIRQDDVRHAADRKSVV